VSLDGITYLCTDNFGNRIEELPFTNVTFSVALGTSGPFSAQLDVSDARVQSTSWVAATAPNLSQWWVDINGALVYGGRIQRRSFQSPSTVQIQGLDQWSYFAQRLQAEDYSATWNTQAKAAGSASIAWRIINDALNSSVFSMPILLGSPPSIPSTFWITMALPISQRTTVEQIVQELATLGWQVGFDFGVDWAYVAGIPTAQITLSYPRRGRVAGSTGLMMDLSQATAINWDEDGTQQATEVTETSTGMGGVALTDTWEPAMTTDGYPLLESAASHSVVSSTTLSNAILVAFAQDDLALAAYPVVTPKITMPMKAEPQIGEWIAGDEVRLLAAKQGGNVAPPVPRFPNGLDTYMRIIRADVTIPEQGVPTTAYTFNMPYSSTPQRPPQ